MAEIDGQQIETIEEAKASGTTDVELWLKKIKAAQDEEKEWRHEACEAVKVYEASEDCETSFNLFHSNVETLVPALYNTTPIPDVRRRFGDKDPVAKMGADIIERSVSYAIDQYPFDTVITSAVKASCTAGRGTARIRYTPQVLDESAGGVGYQKIESEPVAWDKWGRGPALYWEDVPFVYFEHDLSKEDLAGLVGDDEDANKRIAAYGTSESDEKKSDDKGILKTVRVYEIWDKASRQVIFITPRDTNFALKTVPDPLELPGFFPVPQPLQILTRVKSLVPICPYEVYEPLLEELDKVTKRITKLISQLRVRGIADAGIIPELELLRNCDDGEYIAAKDVTQFSTGGGLDKAIHHFPMQETIAALQQLYVQRDQIKATIYEVTGLSDILRGASDPNETATAQQIKQDWGSLRVKDMQSAVARFVRDIFRMKAAIISKHFEPQNISQMTSLPSQSQDPQQAQAEQQKFMAAIQLLKQDSQSYRIDIESDSTVRADLGKKQEQMNMFLQGTAQFSSAIAGLIQGAPQIAQPALPVMVEVFSQFARHFKLGKQAEDALESLGEQAMKASQQPPEEDPAKKQAEADMQAKQQEAQMAAQALQMKAAHEERMAQIKEQVAAMDLQIKQAELAIKQEELNLKRQTMQMDAQAKVMDIELRREGAQMDREDRMGQREHDAETNAIKVSAMKQQAAAKQRPEART